MIPEIKSISQFISLVLAFISTVALAQIAYAEVRDCKVGDESKGYWMRITNDPNNCPYPGARAAESSWPTDSNFQQGFFRIDGLYKITAVICAEGFSLNLPPERPQCITGLAAAYAAWGCAQYQKGSEPQPACCRTTYTASGSSCKQHYEDDYGNESTGFVRYFECGFLLYEWQCNPQPPEPPSKMQGFGPVPCLKN